MAGLPIHLQHQHQNQNQHQTQPPSIWAQTTTPPPRGPCSQRTSLVTSCPCHRFMLHPLQAHTSFACDGCGHHASFHRMESKEEEEVVRRWRREEMEEKERRVREEGREREMEGKRERGEMVVVGVGVAPGKKRRRIGGAEREREVVELLGGDEGEEDDAVEDVVPFTAGGREGKGKGKGKGKGRG